MKIGRIIFLITSLAISSTSFSQVESAGGVTKVSENKKTEKPKVAEMTEKRQHLYDTKMASDADVSYQKWVYRRLDLEKEKNAPLYYPEEIIDGQDNLFRIIYRLVSENKIPAYEYLDGKEIFSDEYKINFPEMVQRFELGEEVPSSQVTNYYIIEKWEFDNRSNSMKTSIEAICPVMDKYGDFGDRLHYPMFWVKYNQLRPYLANSFVAADDDNNLQRYSIDDYFTLRLYDGEIYKTKNNRNLSLAQMYPDEDAMKQAQDSIDARLNNYGKDLWVPTREEYLAQKELQEQQESYEGETVVTSKDNLPERKVTSSRSKKKSTKKSAKKKYKEPNNSSDSAAEKSVRRRKK